MQGLYDVVETGLIVTRFKISEAIRKTIALVREGEEGANTIEVVIAVAVFAAIAVAVFGRFRTAIMNKGESAANIIESAE